MHECTRNEYKRRMYKIPYKLKKSKKKKNENVTDDELNDSNRIRIIITQKKIAPSFEDEDCTAIVRRWAELRAFLLMWRKIHPKNV